MKSSLFAVGFAALCVLAGCTADTSDTSSEADELRSKPACAKLGVAACEAATDRCETSSKLAPCAPGTLCSHLARFVCIDKKPIACSTLDQNACAAASDDCTELFKMPECKPGTLCSQLEMFDRCETKVVHQ